VKGSGVLRPPRRSPAWRRARDALRAWRSARALRQAAWAVAFVLFLTAVFASVSLPRQVDLRVGEVAPFTVRAPRDFVDEPATLAAQNRAAAEVAPVYQVDPAATEAIMTSGDTALQTVVAARQAYAEALRDAQRSAGARRAGPAPSPGAILRAAALGLERQLPLPVPLAAYEAVLQAPAPAFDALAGAARATLAATLGRGVRAEDLAATRSALAEDIGDLPGGGLVARFFGAFEASVVAPNEFVDGPATDAAVARARAAVRPVWVTAGQVIVRAGDRVTADEITLLRDAGLLRPGGRAGALGTALLLALGLGTLVWAYATRLEPQAFERAGATGLFAALCAGTALAVRLTAPLSPFLAPVTWAALVGAVALGPGPAVFAAALGGLSAGLLDGSLGVALAATAAGWTAVLATRRWSERSDVLRAGAYAALGGAAAVLLVHLFVGQDDSLLGLLGLKPAPLWRDVAAAASSGLLSAALALGTLPFAEALGVLTPFRLLELAHPARPLLRRLVLEAPGTYHHSLMVANLAEAACEAIGADALLARAGAYYHDVGKLRRPHFFVENQWNGRNPHDRLSPWVSAAVILRHVPDGVELARQAGLPEALIEFIRTHHGTTRIDFFYHKAREAAARAEAEGAPRALADEDFRYPGPLPRTRETAVVMLADAVEAAVRASREQTPEGIARVVGRIVDARLAEGQLDEASLTLREVGQIKAAFCRVFAGAYHARIEYPREVPRALGSPRLGAGDAAQPEPPTRAVGG
jgi:putative nucleotidyltransferase with HDIG domain